MPFIKVTKIILDEEYKEIVDACNNDKEIKKAIHLFGRKNNRRKLIKKIRKYINNKFNKIKGENIINLIKFLRKRLIRDKIKSFEHLKEVIIKNCDDEIIECGEFDKNIVAKLKNEIFKNKKLELLEIWYEENVFDVSWYHVDWVVDNDSWDKDFDDKTKTNIKAFENAYKVFYFIHKDKNNHMFIQIVGLYNRGYDRQDFIISIMGN